MPDQRAYLLALAAGSPTPDWAAKVEWLEAQGALRREDAAAKAAGLPDDGEALARLTWGCGGGGIRLTHRHLDQTAVSAAWGGHLHVLAWLLEAQLLELHEDVFNAAARSGSVDLLAWLRQRGCPWDSNAYSAAVDTGCEAVLEWLVEQGCPMEESGQPYLDACRWGDLGMVRCLRRLGVPWGPDGKVFFLAMERLTTPPQLRWLLEEGCPVDYEAACKRVAGWREGGWHSAILQRAERVLTLLAEHGARRQP
ncbi:hypothetical protein GPECTOR_23g161 [Gonium pectorale]|uniref:Ankyrin repeat domain-containing protein n=1 Tax=Gonium pectorale TaxID=33097 RepID=A0A150GGZ4_GONPE|nr:hypothetical protein GPECTOR_23g161 [Gonium pectorale]|eukprot:KXZ49077.1 hypothetical protein GPECTOR_23g161 [Gonium pectorale]